MSKFTLFVPVLFLPALLAQNPDPLLPPPPTQLENFLIQRNTLLVQETNRVGKVDRRGDQILVDGIAARHVVRRSDPMKGLRVTLTQGARFYVDQGELDQLSRVMQMMETHLQSWQENSPEYQQDMFFTTKSGLEMGLHYREGVVSADVGGPAEGGFRLVRLDLEGFRELRRLLEEGNAWLRSR